MRLFKIVLPIAAVLVAIAFFYMQNQSAPVTPLSDVRDASDASNTNAVSTTDNSTLDSASGNNSDSPNTINADNQDDSTDAPLDTGSSETSTNANADAVMPQSLSPDYPELFGYEVGVDDISEEDFHALVDRLRNDPVLMGDVLNELRAETDPARLKRLTALLGETGSNAVLPVSEELVYSTNSATRKAGLDLLSRLAPQNPAAYDIANSILGSEADPAVLVSTMNVLAVPRNANADVKSTAIAQIMPLANHESAAVRRHSVSLLVRLTNEPTLAPVLYNALSDSDASVREAAVYAYAKYPYQTAEAVERMLEIAENPSEERGVRSGAILALSSMSPDDATKTRVQAAENQMRKALRTQ